MQVCTCLFICACMCMYVSMGKYIYMRMYVCGVYHLIATIVTLIAYYM